MTLNCEELEHANANVISLLQKILIESQNSTNQYMYILYRFVCG